MNKSEQSSLLKGVRVLDLSQYIPGPYTSLQMAELGAQVVKVEPPGGDPMRTFGAEQGEISSLYRYLNRGKRIVELNLKQEQGRTKFNKWLSEANVLLEGFRPGALNRLGYTPQLLAEINPRLVVCSLSGFGQDGPDALRGGHDLGYTARAGLFSGQQEKPALVFPPVADHAGALQALSAILAALYQQEKTGSGCYLDMSLYDPVLAWQYMTESDSVSRFLTGDLAYYNIYETADNRYITLAALEAKFWSSFCKAVNKPEWIERQADPLPQTSLKAELDKLFRGHSLGDWQAILDDVDCCFEPIPLTAEASRCEHAQVRGLDSRFPGKINHHVTPLLRELELTEPEDINWINE